MWVSFIEFCTQVGQGQVYPQYYHHDDVIKWKHFPRYWPFVRGIHRSLVNSLHKGQWRRALMFFFDLHQNKRLSKQSRGWWLEMLSCTLWRHCNVKMSSYRNTFCITGPHFVRRILWWPVDFPLKGPLMRSCTAFVIVRLNKPLNKQLSCWWFEKP